MLKELYCDSFKENGKTRDKIIFSEGLNVVLGKKKNGEEHNSIGKSTLLLIIDFIFGGENYKKSEAYKHGEQIFNYCFEFANERFYFIRTNKTDNVIECNPDYSPKTTKKLEEYRDFLLEKYGVENLELTFRNIVGPYSRIFHKDKNITPGHVLESNIHQNESPIKVFEKLNKVYYKIKEKDEKVVAADNKKKVLTKARKLKVQLEETEVINVKEIKAEVDSLEQERDELIQNQNAKIKLLDEEKIAKIIELNKKIRILQKKQRQLLSRKTTVTDNLENNIMPSKASFDALLTFFPNTNIKHLEDIEAFHTKLTAILEEEYKENLLSIENALKEIEPQIDSLMKELNELEKDTGNFKMAFLEKFSEIDNKIKELNSKLEKKNQTKPEAKELKELKSQLQSVEGKILEELSQNYNLELSSLCSEILEPNILPVSLEFPKTNQYNVSIPNDDGTGDSYTSELIFDLAVLNKTELPFLIHDSYLYSNIRGKRLDRIISKYNDFQKKQIFIAIDQIETLEPETRVLINERKVISLYANGGELFGESWNKS